MDMHADTSHSSAVKPFEIDKREYPFESRWHQTPEGRMHYLDEGRGEVMLFVHGTPTWSFLYRNIIRHFSKRFRCIAADNLGFGLSEKRPDADYRPEAHSRRLEELIESLGLENITLVVHDFGGPIGLNYALRHPENIKKMVIFNTWMWSNQDDGQKVKLAKVLGGAIGKFLYRYVNFSPKFLLKMAFHDKSKLTPTLHAHYLRPFAEKSQREAPLVLAQNLLSDWFGTLWEQREKIVSIPALLLWGMNDPAFGKKELERWEGFLKNTWAVRLEKVGHFPQEEALPKVLSAMDEFVAKAV